MPMNIEEAIKTTKHMLKVLEAMKLDADGSRGVRVAKEQDAKVTPEWVAEMRGRVLAGSLVRIFRCIEDLMPKDLREFVGPEKRHCRVQ